MDVLIGVSILLTSVAGIVTSITLLWVKVLRPFFRFTKRIGKVVDVVQDLPEWCLQVDEALKELRPNHGGSIKDRIGAMKTLLEHHISDKNMHHNGGGNSDLRQ